METIIKTESLEQTIGLPVSSKFITANTIDVSISEVKNKHIIPSFSKDNEPLISHSDFIELTGMVAESVFKNESFNKPILRVSHPVLGRIPEARQKPANALLEHEKTRYYERMAFLLEIQSIRDTIQGNELTLTVGGVKAYSLDNLNGRKGTEQHFKVFIGFKNTVCTNLCISTDGYSETIKARNINELMEKIYLLFSEYNTFQHIQALERIGNYGISESQFASFVGRARMYQCLAPNSRKSIPELKLSDTQINEVVKGFYKDANFSGNTNGIGLWQLYNLFTGANKSSYIDSFLDRGVNSFDFVNSLAVALDKNQDHWFLN